MRTSELADCWKFHCRIGDFLQMQFLHYSTTVLPTSHDPEVASPGRHQQRKKSSDWCWAISGSPGKLFENIPKVATLGDILTALRDLRISTFWATVSAERYVMFLPIVTGITPSLKYLVNFRKIWRCLRDSGHETLRSLTLIVCLPAIGTASHLFSLFYSHYWMTWRMKPWFLRNSKNLCSFFQGKWNS